MVSYRNLQLAIRNWKPNFNHTPRPIQYFNSDQFSRLIGPVNVVSPLTKVIIKND